MFAHWDDSAGIPSHDDLRLPTLVAMLPRVVLRSVPSDWSCWVVADTFISMSLVWFMPVDGGGGGGGTLCILVTHT